MLEIKRDIKNNVSSAKSVSNYGHGDKLTVCGKSQANFPLQNNANRASPPV